MPTILLVEDDVEIRQIQKDYLVKDGYSIVEAGDGQEALEAFESHRIDGVVLDLNLPQVDGISVCREIRQTSSVPIIMVTARTSEIDELLGLDVGADDYLKKPFSPKVLVARVKALLKRPEMAADIETISIADVVINIRERTVTKKGKPVKLTSTQFNMLSLMASQKGKVFNREELISRGYDKSLPPDIFDRTIDTHIKNIRKAIEDNPKKPKLIKTIRGYGYKCDVQT
jgi:DNA-binding response OmpR family regulator